MGSLLTNVRLKVLLLLGIQTCTAFAGCANVAIGQCESCCLYVCSECAEDYDGGADDNGRIFCSKQDRRSYYGYHLDSRH